MMTRQEEFVRHFQGQNSGSYDKDEIDIFLAWLQENGPDEWRRWAIGWNWDHGPSFSNGSSISPAATEERPSASITWRIQTSTCATSHSKQPWPMALGVEIMPLLTKICERWREGPYSAYQYHPSEGAMEFLTQGKEALLAIAAAAPWDVPDGLATSGIQGEPNSFSETVDGIPVEMLRALGEDW